MINLRPHTVGPCAEIFFWLWLKFCWILQCRERVGWRPPRSGLVRCTFQPSKAGGRPSAHQELAAADPHPHQIGLKVEREAQEHLLAGIAVESRKRLTFKASFLAFLPRLIASDRVGVADTTGYTITGLWRLEAVFFLRFEGLYSPIIRKLHSVWKSIKKSHFLLFCDNFPRF